MALEKQVITLSLRQGLDTKSDPKQVISGRLVVLENGVLTKLGAVQKRPGSDALSQSVAGSGSIGSARILAAYKNQSLLGTGAEAYSYSASQGAWIDKGLCEAMRVSVTPVVRNSYQQTTQDAAVHPIGVAVVAWEDSAGGARYSIVDMATGQPIITSAQIGITAVRPKCAALGNYLVVVYYEQFVANHLRFVAIPVTNPQTLAVPIDITANANANQAFDVTVSNDRMFVAYANTAGGATQVSARYVTSALVVSSEVQLSASVVPTAVATFADQIPNAWVAWANGTDVRAAALDFNLAAVFSPVVVDTAAARNVTGIAPLGSTATILDDVAGGQTYNTLTRSGGVAWLPAAPGITTWIASATGGVLAAGTYYYVVTALGSVSGETISSSEIAVTTTGSTSSIAISWSAVPGASGYRVYRGTTAGGESLYYAPGNVLSFTDTGFGVPPTLVSATPSTTGGTLATGTYYYVVTALGTTGETLKSNELSAAVTGPTGSVALVWPAVQGATGYRVYRGTAAGAESVYYAPGNVTTYTDTGAASTAGTPPVSSTFNAATPPASNAFLGVTSGSVLLRSVGLASKPWYVNSAVHFLAGYSSALQPSYFVATTAGKVAGRLAPGVAGGLTAKTILPEVTRQPTGAFTLAYLVTDKIGPEPQPGQDPRTAGLSLAQTGVNLASLDFTAPQMALELSDDLHLTGGLLYSYDGSQVVEHGFHTYPENISRAPSGTGGSLSAGSYQYVVVWEWWDNYVLHQSAPSVPASVTTTTATSKVDLTIPTLRLTNRSTPISVAIYRTAVNGSVFYRITPPTSPLLNSTTADTVAYSDTAADSAIIGNAQLYTTGGEVENWAAPAPAAICNYGDRTMLVSAENPLEIWYSKQVIQGVPVEFSAAFTMTVDQRGGPVTALSQMDEKLILFKERWIFWLVGDGPAPNGTPVPAYPPAQIVTADSGCKNPKSLVLIPSGLMYQSDKGIYLLGRDLSVTYIGAAVEAYNGANVTSAQQVPNTTQVRFTLDSGACLVYDWLVDQWATFTSIVAADAAVLSGAYTYVQSGGRVIQEVPTSFVDVGQPIKLRLKTSWLSFAGLQGLQRVWEMNILGEYRSAHTLRVSIAYDFEPTPLQVVDVPASILLAQTPFGQDSPFGANVYGGKFPTYQFRVRLLREKCQAIQVTLEDNQVAPYGEGMALSAISFLVGVIAPQANTPANRTFGA